MPDTRVSELDFAPRFRYGSIGKGRGTGTTFGSGYQFYRLVPLSVIELSTTLDIDDYTVEGVRAGMERYDHCVDLLKADGANHILLSGIPISAQLGRSAALRYLRAAEERVDVPCDSSLEAVVSSLQFLGVRRLAVASRWAGSLNDAVTRYLAEADIEVVAATERGQWAADTGTMSFDTGFDLSIELGREAARIAPDADAVLIAGGAAPTLHAIPILEGEIGKPVLTNISSEVWSGLVRTQVIPPMTGWGALLAGA